MIDSLYSTGFRFSSSFIKLNNVWRAVRIKRFIHQMWKHREQYGSQERRFIFPLFENARSKCAYSAGYYCPTSQSKGQPCKAAACWRTYGDDHDAVVQEPEPDEGQRVVQQHCGTGTNGIESIKKKKKKSTMAAAYLHTLPMVTQTMRSFRKLVVETYM